MSMLCQAVSSYEYVHIYHEFVTDLGIRFCKLLIEIFNCHKSILTLFCLAILLDMSSVLNPFVYCVRILVIMTRSRKCKTGLNPA